MAITISSANASRNGAMSTGSVASSVTSMNASTNPPTTAPESEPSPPITLAMKALSTGLKPIVGSTVPRRARMKIAATPASAPEIANAAMITRLAEMPMRRVTWKSWLAASMPRPCTERRRKSVSTTSESRQVIVVITGSQPIEYVPPKRKAVLNTFGIATPF